MAGVHVVLLPWGSHGSVLLGFKHDSCDGRAFREKALGSEAEYLHSISKQMGDYRQDI